MGLTACWCCRHNYWYLMFGIARNVLAFIGSIWVGLTVYFVLFYND